MNTRNKQFRFTGQDGANGGEFEEVPSGTFGTGNNIPHFFAVYPYISSTEISDIDPYKVRVILPSEQTYREGTFGLGSNTMIAVSDDDFLAFKNVGGYLRFRFWGDNIRVSSVKLEGNNNEKLAGLAYVTPGDNPTTEMDGTATTSITLNCPEPVTLGTSSTDFTEFIFVLPPTTFSGGFKVTVTDDLGGVYNRTITTSSQTINAVQDAITSLGGLECFTNLTSLDISNHDIASVPLTTLTKLVFFKCQNNTIIQQIDFSHNTALETIDMNTCNALQSQHSY